FEKSYPADYISEGIDQTRGWFYTLHSIGTFLSTRGAFGDKLRDMPAFKNCLVNELILDKQGQKMSKSKKNSVDPFELIRKYGADATRWYLISNSPVWRPTLFDEEGVAEVQRKFFSTLLNTYSFFALYANVDGFQNAEPRIPTSERPEIDRWILSELNSLVKDYRAWMDEYDVTRAARAVSDFTIDHLSNWYVRRNRRRFWKSEKGKDKTAAYQTLHECIGTVSKELYRNLTPAGQSNAPSVHLTEFPEVEDRTISVDLEQKMNRAMRLVSLVRAMRMKTNLKVRQPLRKILIPVHSDREKKEIEQMREVILEEINVKDIEFVTEESGIFRKKAKPNFKTLGPKYGKSVQAVAGRIRELTSAEIGALQKQGSLALSINGSDYTVLPEDVEILHEDVKGWLVESDGTVTVALDAELTEELIEEGLAREFVNRVQNLRKDSGFEVTDRIKIYYKSSDRLSKALDRMASYVQQETLATEIRNVTKGGNGNVSFSTEDINGERAEIGVGRI
ncbi:MAG: ileS, partial [Bacteroidetes bacterium]|nr:ileS [Bacteroidota bacterium]